MSDRDKKAPKVKQITSQYTFETFDSLLVIDNGSDGFRVQDDDAAIAPWPTGIPLAIGKQEGKACGPFIIMAPETGSLDVTAIYYT